MPASKASRADNLAAVHVILNKSTSPLTTAEIARKMGASEQSALRWLNDLSRERLVERTEQKKGYRWNIPGKAVPEAFGKLPKMRAKKWAGDW